MKARTTRRLFLPAWARALRRKRTRQRCQVVDRPRAVVALAPPHAHRLRASRRRAQGGRGHAGARSSSPRTNVEQWLAPLGHVAGNARPLAAVDLSLSDPAVQRVRRSADLRGDRRDPLSARAMLAFTVQNHPHSAFAAFRGELVRGLAQDAPSYSGVGASGNPGAVQNGWPDVPEYAPRRLCSEMVSIRASPGDYFPRLRKILLPKVRISLKEGIDLTAGKSCSASDLL